MIILLSLLLGATVEAKEMEILMEDSFVESLNCNPDEFDEEVLTVTQDELIGYFTLTAYCHCSSCCGSSTGITASGARVQPNHTIAADTRVLPFDTVVYINGEDYTVEDTGGAIKGNRIDIYFSTHSEAQIFGRKYEGVYTRMEKKIVLEPVNIAEYINISGDFMSKGTAESVIDKVTGSVTWYNRRGDVVATRVKNASGEYENRVEQSVYKEWKARRR